MVRISNTLRHRVRAARRRIDGPGSLPRSMLLEVMMFIDV
jgi:hypothetical protein